MRSITFVASASFVWTALACSGIEIPYPDGPPPPPPQAPALPALDVADATTIVLAQPVMAEGMCEWRAWRFPGTEDLGVLASLGDACPESFAVASSGANAALVSAAGGVVRRGQATENVSAPPSPPQGVGLSGDELWVCAPIEGAADAPQAKAWAWDGKEWQAKGEGPAPTEGQSHPCTAVPGFPTTAVQSAPAVQAWLETQRPDAASAEALHALKDQVWGLSSSGWTALRDDGSLPGPAVAWRAKGGDWALVPEAVDGAVVAEHGPWLVIVAGGKTTLLDARTGELTWSTSGVAVVLSDEVTGPRGEETPADATEPETEPEPEPGKPDPAPAAPPKPKPAPEPSKAKTGPQSVSKAKRQH